MRSQRRLIESSSNVATVSVTITSVNDAPVGVDAAVTTSRNTPVGGQLQGVDVEGDTLTFAIAKGKSPKGTVVISPSGAFTYTPPNNFTGTETFTFQVSDGLLSGSGKVTVGVTAP